MVNLTQNILEIFVDLRVTERERGWGKKGASRVLCPVGGSASIPGQGGTPGLNHPRVGWDSILKCSCIDSLSLRPGLGSTSESYYKGQDFAKVKSKNAMTSWLGANTQCAHCYSFTKVISCPCHKGETSSRKNYIKSLAHTFNYCKCLTFPKPP